MVATAVLAGEVPVAVQYGQSRNVTKRTPQAVNVADRRIVELLAPGDLVITADIPLAAEVVAGGGTALDPRGEPYTDANVGERLAVRDLLDELRGALSPADRRTTVPRIDMRSQINSIAG